MRGADAAELLHQERRYLKLQSAQARSSTKKLVDGFNRFFFSGATEVVFEALFREIKAGIPLGLRMPIAEFEERFAPIRREVKKGRDQGRPFHSTISITLLGLKYEYPEWHFANDIVVALAEAREIERQLEVSLHDSDEPNLSLKHRWVEAEPLARRQAAKLRWCVTACFSLLEAYLSGLAWRVSQTQCDRLNAISAKDRKTIEDVGPGFRDRLVRIPRIVSGRPLWDDDDADMRAILELKRTRDALMHPSPFSIPERFGGRDKLSLIYELEHEMVETYVRVTANVLTRVFHHINGDAAPRPTWLADLCTLAVGAGAAADAGEQRHATDLLRQPLMPRALE